jgi:hypothetical protein
MQVFSGGRLMWNRPTEVNFNIRDFAFSHSEQFRVPEPLSVICSGLVSHESSVATNDDAFDIELCRGFTIGPAPLEIAFSVDPIVQRAREVKIFGDQRFNRRSVFVGVALKTGSNDLTDVILNVRHITSSFFEEKGILTFRLPTCGSGIYCFFSL